MTGSVPGPTTGLGETCTTASSTAGDEIRSGTIQQAVVLACDALGRPYGAPETELASALAGAVALAGAGSPAAAN